MFLILGISNVGQTFVGLYSDFKLSKGICDTYRNTEDALYVDYNVYQYEVGIDFEALSISERSKLKIY